MKRWQIKFNGCELTESDVTPLDVAVVSKLTGLDEWSVLDPRSSPSTLIAWTVLAVSHGMNCSVDEAHMLVNSQPILDVLNGYEVVESERSDTDKPAPDTFKQRDAVKRLMDARARQVANSEG